MSDPARSGDAVDRIEPPARTRRSTTGRATAVRDQKSARSMKGCAVSICRTSTSLMPLTSASDKRIPYRPATFSTRYCPVDVLTSNGRMVTPLLRASSRISRWVHPRVVGQHPGQERRWVVPLQPGGVVGGQGERRRMGLAEPRSWRRPGTSQTFSTVARS